MGSLCRFSFSVFLSCFCSLLSRRLGKKFIFMILQNSRHNFINLFFSSFIEVRFLIIISDNLYIYINQYSTNSITRHMKLQQTVLNSVKAEDPNFSGNGYVSLCIIYAVFSLGSWVAPSIVAVIRSKWSMVIKQTLMQFTQMHA